MEVGLLEQALKGLLISGPVSAVLGIICYLLWKQNVVERDRHFKEERGLIKKLHRQYRQMLVLAVRVQRAVEAIAGIKHDSTEVEAVLAGEGNDFDEDDEDDEDDEEETDTKRRKKQDRHKGQDA